MKRFSLLFIATIVLAAAPLVAQRTLVIEEFRADITVNRDGSIDVTETIRPRKEAQWW